MAVITQAQAKDALLTGFNTGWADRTPVAWDNTKFSPPDTDPWVRFAIRMSESEQDSLGRTGNRKFRRTGRVFVQIFQLNNEQGLTGGDTLTDAVLSVMEGNTFSGVYTLAGSPQEIGPSDKWWQINVSIPFWFQTTK